MKDVDGTVALALLFVLLYATAFTTKMSDTALPKMLNPRVLPSTKSVPSRSMIRCPPFHPVVPHSPTNYSPQCKKEAVTDAIKRTLRNFGNLLGNCLYDKQYTQEVVKIKVEPLKFDRSALHRRPEFEEGASESSNRGVGAIIDDGASGDTSVAAATNLPANKASNSRSMPPPPLPHRPSPQQAGTVVSPTHMKSEPVAPASHNHPQSRCQPDQRPFITPQRSAAPVSRSPCSIATSTSNSRQSHSVFTTHMPTIDPDEVSYFNSDDDALFMQLDMERVGSVTLEEDCPIEYADAENGEDADATVSANVEPRHSEGEGAHVQQQRASATRHVPDQNENLAHVLPPARKPAQVVCQRQDLQPQPLPPQAGLQKPQHHTAQQQQSIPHHQSNNNAHQHSTRQASKDTQAPTASHLTTPSMAMGGFHFPPGVVRVYPPLLDFVHVMPSSAIVPLLFTCHV